MGYKDKDTKKTLKADKKEREADKNLKGLGGWLIFPIIGLFGSIFIILAEILDLAAYPEADASFIIIIDLCIVALAIITLVQIFNKKKNAPKWAIAFYITAGVINLLNGIFYMVIGNVIWIFYFLKSVRVKNTFKK